MKPMKKQTHEECEILKVDAKQIMGRDNSPSTKNGFDLAGTFNNLMVLLIFFALVFSTWYLF